MIKFINTRSGDDLNSGVTAREVDIAAIAFHLMLRVCAQASYAWNGIRNAVEKWTHR